MKRFSFLFFGLLCWVVASGQTDTLGQPQNHAFSINATVWSRGEVRDGALPADNGADYAMFLASKALLRLDYAYKGLEVRVSPNYYGVWGSSSDGSMAISEAWLGLRHQSGLFLRAGRQIIEYDDERIIGSDDWSMVSATHDVLRAGLERGKHKLHLLLAFNQNDENTEGGTYYVDGGQPYKSMQTLWYHVDPTPNLGASLLFINSGMQDKRDDKKNIDDYQQLTGAYIDWRPKDWHLQASGYYQFGHDEYALPIHAWMADAELSWQVNPRWNLRTGYFFMSGDEYFYVPSEGEIGLALKKEVRGFNPIFGSHHEFYGAMDFFYVTTYYGGNTPGLQDFHLGGLWSPSDRFQLDAAYHCLATSIKIPQNKRLLGHELELSATWKPLKDVRVQAGYSFMHGTETMTALKRTSAKNQLHWGWVMLIVTPEFFSVKW